jgi:hypothetical protein
VIAHVYPFSQEQAFVVFERGNDLQAYLQQGPQLAEVRTIFYFTANGIGAVRSSPNATLRGLLWINPDKQIVIYAPPELENSLFTRMYLFNGAGLENFEFVNSWGGEVKLFKVKFDDPPPTDAHKI